MNIDSYNQGTILGYAVRHGPYISNGNGFSEGNIFPYSES